jgi:hypothetical protein
MSSVELAPAEHSIDGFLDRRITLMQPTGGHRAGLDAALLQALVPQSARGASRRSRRGVGHGCFLPRRARPAGF